MSLAGRPADRAEVERLGRLVTSWASSERDSNEMVLAVDSLVTDTGVRWFVRLAGEEKQVTTVWLHLRERMLHVETQFMPAPEENEGELYELLLRLNGRVSLLRFAIGDEDAVFLQGEVPLAAVDEDVLDSLVGAAWQYTEQWFRPCMRIGYRTKFRG